MKIVVAQNVDKPKYNTPLRTLVYLEDRADKTKRNKEYNTRNTQDLKISMREDNNQE